MNCQRLLDTNYSMNLFDLHNSMWYNGLAYNIDAWIAGGCKMMMAVKLAF